jgi:hypothetical protein
MSELTEIIFDSIDRSKLLDAISYFSDKNNNHFSIEAFFENEDNVQVMISDIHEFLLRQKPDKLMFKIDALHLYDNIYLKNVNLWFYINNLTFDMEFDFDRIQKENNLPNLINNIFVFSKRIAELFEVKSFYSGMEPARDVDTRFFTNNRMGPLILK